MYNHKEYMKQYNKKRSIDRKKHRLEHPFKGRKRSHSESNMRYRLRNKEKCKLQHNAGSIARYGVKTGKLIKTACIICGELKVEGHHQDYAKPYDVIWLCRLHHRIIHGRQLC